MRPHHHVLLGCFLSFVTGMILGLALSKEVFIWFSIIILVALALGFLAKSTMKKPRRRRLPPMQQRNG